MDFSTTTTINLNQNSQTLGDCVKEVSNFGSTAYHSICTGQSVSVPWGTMDWVSLAVFGLIVASVVLLAVWAAKSVLKD